MINPNDSLRYMNVVSRKYIFHYSEINNALEDFTKDLVSTGATLKGPLFYSLSNIPTDEMMHVEFFMPIVEESIKLHADMFQHSYFSIEDMVSICMFGDFENNTEVAYGMLLSYMQQNMLEQVTPVFHIISGDKSFPYVFVKIGTMQQTIDGVWK